MPWFASTGRSATILPPLAVTAFLKASRPGWKLELLRQTMPTFVPGNLVMATSPSMADSSSWEMVVL